MKKYLLISFIPLLCAYSYNPQKVNEMKKDKFCEQAKELIDGCKNCFTKIKGERTDSFSIGENTFVMQYYSKLKIEDAAYSVVEYTNKDGCNFKSAFICGDEAKFKYFYEKLKTWFLSCPTIHLAYTDSARSSLKDKFPTLVFTRKNEKVTDIDSYPDSIMMGPDSVDPYNTLIIYVHPARK